jgi:hypothetical protein
MGEVILVKPICILIFINGMKFLCSTRKQVAKLFISAFCLVEGIMLVSVVRGVSALMAVCTWLTFRVINLYIIQYKNYLKTDQ